MADIPGFIASVFTGTLEFFSFLDTPGTYIIWTVVGIVMIPLFSKSIYYQYANPHDHYSMPLMRKAVMTVIFLTAWLVFGYANIIRFIPQF